MPGNAEVFKRHAEQCRGERARTLRDARRLAAAGQAEAAHDQLQRAGFWRQLERTWRQREAQEREEDWLEAYHRRVGNWREYYQQTKGGGGPLDQWVALMDGSRGQEEHGRMAWVRGEMERLYGPDWKGAMDRQAEADKLWGVAMSLGSSKEAGIGLLRSYLQRSYRPKYGPWPMLWAFDTKDLALVRQWLERQPKREEGKDA